MAKNNVTPTGEGDVDRVQFVEGPTVVLGDGKHINSTNSVHHNVYWNGNPWIEIYPKDGAKWCTVVPLSQVRHMRTKYGA